MPGQAIVSQEDGAGVKVSSVYHIRTIKGDDRFGHPLFYA